MNISEEAKRKLAEIREKEEFEKTLSALIESGICPKCGKDMRQGFIDSRIVKHERPSFIISELYLTWECFQGCEYEIRGEKVKGFKKLMRKDSLPLGQGLRGEGTEKGSCRAEKDDLYSIN